MKKSFILLAFVLAIFINAYCQKSHSDVIDVLEYSIVLDISDIENSFIQGYTDIRFLPIQENTSIIYLDLQNLNVDSIVLEAYPIESFDYNDTLISINLETPVSPSDEVSIRVYYNGNPQMDPSGWGGFYFMSGYAFNLGVGFDDVPHNYGRVWFPCNDDFIDRAIYNTIITTKPEHTAVCAGELIEVTQDPESLKKTYFWRIEETLPTYLVSVSVGSYVLLSHIYHGIERDIPVEFYIYPGDSAHTAQSFVNIDSVLSIYENKFGAYKWNRVGFVSVPFSSGAMEHATNIAMGRAFIDGTLSYEDLFYHELAHMWFGDAITCSSAEDMWINEGWATYCETVFIEYLRGKSNALTYRRKYHETVLRYYHIEDGGFHALFPMDQSLTYSSTVYEKGASVAHALRGYLGDELFFDAISEFVNQNAYNSVSSYDMRDFHTNYTGIDMTDFFNDWVFTGGFVHYSIDSTKIVQNGENYDVTVYMKQKLRGRTEFANSNRVEVSFIDANLDANTQLMEFDGEFGEQTFTVPFNPILTLCDYNERMSDATIDETKFLTTSGTKTYSYNYFKASVQNIVETDTVLLRITHNWAAPDTFKNQIPGLIIANHRYWTVEGNFPPTFLTKGEFAYSTALNSGLTGYLDNDFITNSLDSIVLLYRPDRATEWTIEPASNQTIMKKLTVDSLKNGEYSLGIYDWELYVKNKQNIMFNNVSIFPNPNEGLFYLNFGEEFSGMISIYDMSGRILYSKDYNYDEEIVFIDLSSLPDGLYIINAKNSVSGKEFNRKFIIQK
ncbi:MAG TPA: M1 family aminopeptidase [Bacteroidales bacterium]|nr:M1 family aminopeptidase [Bacteroidales bacterium]